MLSVGYYELVEELFVEMCDMYRVIVLLMEELEVVDWYNQCVDVCKDVEFKVIFEYNWDEEKEYVLMFFEWIWCKDQVLLEYFRSYLFMEKLILYKQGNIWIML